ncbi:hypothetical protein CTRI78_v009045 [Colletotrichum trifolii]|uniref:Uncharacterized protein n=1 Tax=Colletotrichum trifolii TaxID=5466 RepID=A0A4R8QRQ5_COLTR|nr:hypothetical protein CTRI78_v009045 [Colletotrichum trifolii]
MATLHSRLILQSGKGPQQTEGGGISRYSAITRPESRHCACWPIRVIQDVSLLITFARSSYIYPYCLRARTVAGSSVAVNSKASWYTMRAWVLIHPRASSTRGRATCSLNRRLANLSCARFAIVCQFPSRKHNSSSPWVDSVARRLASPRVGDTCA